MFSELKVYKYCTYDLKLCENIFFNFDWNIVVAKFVYIYALQLDKISMNLSFALIPPSQEKHF